jgi:anaerobic magnesium-protoporphyrin IX monomethyl ester cyclase
VRLLRENHIVSLVNIIYGLQDETLGTIAAKLKQLYDLDPDILNAVYLTPHFWTAVGRTTDPGGIIQTDLARWTYRNQVIAAPSLSPSLLFWGVKLTEALFHLRPRALWRLFFGADARVRKILRASLAVGFRVVMAEIYEFLFQTRFSARGSVSELSRVTQDKILARGVQ